MKGVEQKKAHLFVGAFILVSMALRLAGITRPFLGNFGDYQASQGMVAQFFIENHFTTLLYPQTHVLVGGEPSLVLLFYPLASLIAGILFSCFGGTLDFWGRFQAVLFFALSAYFLYRLIAKRLGERIALFSLAAFSLSPLTIIYGQSFMNEMAAVFFTVLFFHELLRFIGSRSPLSFFLSVLSLGLVLLMRPNASYLGLPALLLASEEGRERGKRGKFILVVVFLMALALVIPGLWYFHTWKVSQGAPNVYMSIFPQLQVRSSFLSPLIFQWGYYQKLIDSLAGIVLTPLGFTLALIGIFAGILKERKSLFFLVWCLAFLGSSLLIPRKLIDHNFYLLHLVVSASAFVGLGFDLLMKSLPQGKRTQRIALAGFLSLAFLLSMRYAAHPAFKTPEGERHTLAIAKKLAEVTDKEKSRVVVQGTRTFLYYADRYGWNSFSVEKTSEVPDYYRLTNWQNLSPEEWERRNQALKEPALYLEYLKEGEGATHFLVTDPAKFYENADFSSRVHQRYQLLYEAKDVCLIFELNGAPPAA